MDKLKRKYSTVEVTLPNGELRKVFIAPDPESSYDMIYSPMKMNGEGYGVACESLENAIKFMFQQECKHNIIDNDAVSQNTSITPLPYKCTICNKHFIIK